MKHTQGPWKYDKNWALIIGPNKEEVCAVHAATINGESARVHPRIAEHNARLIAAAPELLEALKDTLERLHAYKTLGLSFPLTEQKAEAAIARAEGRTP